MDANKLGRYTALVSFMGGTFLFLGGEYTNDFFFPIAGVYYLIVAFFVNLAILIYVIKDDFKKNIGTILLMLCNIPVVIMYLNLLTPDDGFSSMSTVKFVNQTGFDIEKIEVYEGDSLVNTKHNIETGETFKHEFLMYSDNNANLYYFIDGKLHSNVNLFDCDAKQVADSTVNNRVIYRIGIDSNICLMSLRGD